MAEAKQNDYSKLKYEDVVDVELELSKRKEMIEIALQKVDKSWTVHDTKDQKISVVYKQIGDSNVYTVRGVMTMKVEPDGLDFYYKYQECGYDDIYIKSLKSDANCTEIGIRNLIDKDHQIVYSSNNSGFWIIAARDFTYLRTRFKETDYTFDNTKYETIVGNQAYSVDDKHPFNVTTKKDHVRARIITSGYVLSQTQEQKKENTVQVCYILAMDPAGMIPQWVVNQFAPSKGMEVEKFVKKWGNMKATMEKRKENEFKKDHEPLFQPHPKLMYIEDKGKKEEDDKDKEDQKDDK